MLQTWIQVLLAAPETTEYTPNRGLGVTIRKMSYLWQNVITYRQIDAKNDPNDEAAPSSTQRTSQNTVSTKTFGCATLMEDEDYTNSIQEWMFSTMLPDPLDLTSCYSHCRYTRWFYHIKQAFLKEATDLLSPDSYVSRDMVSSEQHQAI
jgi:hypothetical protein